LASLTSSVRPDGRRGLPANLNGPAGRRIQGGGIVSAFFQTDPAHANWEGLRNRERLTLYRLRLAVISAHQNHI